MNPSEDLAVARAIAGEQATGGNLALACTLLFLNLGPGEALGNRLTLLTGSLPQPARSLTRWRLTVKGVDGNGDWRSDGALDPELSAVLEWVATHGLPAYRIAVPLLEDLEDCFRQLDRHVDTYPAFRDVANAARADDPRLPSKIAALPGGWNSAARTQGGGAILGRLREVRDCMVTAGVDSRTPICCVPKRFGLGREFDTLCRVALSALPECGMPRLPAVDLNELLREVDTQLEAPTRSGLAGAGLADAPRPSQWLEWLRHTPIEEPFECTGTDPGATVLRLLLGTKNAPPEKAITLAEQAVAVAVADKAWHRYSAEAIEVLFDRWRKNRSADDVGAFLVLVRTQGSPQLQAALQETEKASHELGVLIGPALLRLTEATSRLTDTLKALRFGWKEVSP